MSQYCTHIAIGDVEEIPVRVFYSRCPSIEIDRIVLDDGREYEPTNYLEKTLTEEIGEWLSRPLQGEVFEDWFKRNYPHATRPTESLMLKAWEAGWEACELKGA